MYDCDCLIHPFQNDPGTSQNERVASDLLSGATKIDARTLADLLDFFTQMSRNINFYDEHLNVSDWQPFFQRSIPFSLASIIKTPVTDIQQNLALYNSLFEKRPAPPGLQLLIYFIHYRFINKVNACYLSVKGSGLPIESYLEIFIKDKLQQPVKLFIAYTNVAVKWYGIKKIDFSKLSENQVWNIQSADLMKVDDSLGTGGYSKPAQILKLYDLVKVLASPFLDAMKTIAVEAGKNLEKSLFPLKEELQKKHPPHLALLFTFLNIFRQLQNDLNGYTRKHLDFFYREVLQIKPGDAVADKAHIIFEIQKQLDKYLLKKGLKVKDGKDSNKQEIIFSLDDDIVVNKTEVAELRTLFLNNHIIPDANKEGKNLSLLEGVYMAPDATKADGVEKDFTTDPRNFCTLGNKESKYRDPETKIIRPYPNARLGFILASPVLYLKEGRRTVNITVACQLQDPTDDLDPLSPLCGSDGSTNLYSTEALFKKMADAFRQYYVWVTEDLIQEAIKKGISVDTVNTLRDSFLIAGVEKVCGKDSTIYKRDEVVRWNNWWNKFYHRYYETNSDNSEKEVIDSLFFKRRVFKVLFSGEKGWLEASRIKRLRFTSLVTKSDKKTFAIKLKAIMKAGQPAVTFFDKGKLGEDYGTTQPVVKIELDDIIKVRRGFEMPPVSCCVSKKTDSGKLPLSFYYFLRNVKIIPATDPNAGGQVFNTRIDVKVCGLKNFVVQNDESVQDVNGPVYPFGTRPVIRNFDIYTLPIVHDTANSGPSFYLGSKEVFCKKWKSVRINLNWKDKPNDFREYYKGYVVEDPNATPQVFGLDEDHFLVKISSLEGGIWKDEAGFRKLFDKAPADPLPVLPSNTESCEHKNSAGEHIYSQGILLLSSDFGFVNQEFCISESDDIKFDTNTRNGFIKINLRDQDFLHKDYAFVLSRQMMALGRYPDALIEGAVYEIDGNTVIVFKNTGQAIVELSTDIKDTKDKAQLSDQAAAGLKSNFDAAIGLATAPPLDNIDDGERNNLIPLVNDNSTKANDTFSKAATTVTKLQFFQSLLSIFDEHGKIKQKLSVLIPNEPWTPIISNMSLDYTATANIEDIDLIHLYPYAGTYKHEEIKLQPPLFPTFCDEGTLFIGLKNLVPGENLNLLFQMAEATSDSESDKEEVHWHYLDNNVWKPLRTGFEVLDDATENLTASGVIKFATPANMTLTNTIMPPGMYWIKASVAQNSKAVSETIAIIAQAIIATFTNDTANDKGRLSQPLQAGSISKLLVADAFVKSVNQPFDSFGGQVPEIEQQYYVRVSEQLRHKGRAIQKFDYERLALQAFPQLFKVKCINHSFALNAHQYTNDFPYAPGYVTLAVIPDLNKLQAGNSFEPKVSVSILEKIEKYIRERTSPFVRFRAMNPRYESVNFCMRVSLLPGKDENYYREKLREDIRELLAPWAVGKYDKLTFGQCVYRSDIIRFLEQTDYVDFITDFKMNKHNEVPNPLLAKVCPDTPRSILVAGDIEVCINPPDCEDWKTCEDSNKNKLYWCNTGEIPIVNYCNDNSIEIG